MYDFSTALDRSGTAAMKWSAARDPGHLAMGLADSDFGTAPAVVAALRERVDFGDFGYTALTAGVLDAVVSWNRERHGWSVARDSIFVSPGIMPSIVLVLRGVLEPDASVIVQTPGFGPIPEAISANGFAVLENELLAADDRYLMDLGEFARMAQRDDVGAFVLCNPHNPVGRAWREDELAAVAEICAAHDVLVVSDEIHAPVVYPWARFVSFGVVAPPGLRHAVLTGPSKAFNLPALKTSLTIVPHPGLREAFAAERHRLNEDFGVGVLGVAALEAAYRDGGPWLDAFIEHLAGNVGVLESGLGTGPVRVVRPDASFLVWLDFRALGLDDEALAAALRATELELEPGTAFGGAGSGFMRINVATTRERVTDAVGRISRIAR